MGGVRKFEDLDCWNTARELCKRVFFLTCKEKFAKDFKFVSQIRASSGSGMDNIAEGFERGGNKEFLQFLHISKGSFGETRSQLYRSFDQEYISKDEFEEALDLADKSSRQTQNLISSIYQIGYKGHKYK